MRVKSTRAYLHVNTLEISYSLSTRRITSRRNSETIDGKRGWGGWGMRVSRGKKGVGVRLIWGVGGWVSVVYLVDFGQGLWVGGLRCFDSFDVDLFVLLLWKLFEFYENIVCLFWGMFVFGNDGWRVN